MTSRSAPRIPRDVPQPVRKANLRYRRDHREFVKQLDCLCCGRSPCDPAHIRSGIPAGGEKGGAGLKSGDRYIVPLCESNPAILYEGCHDRQHRIGEQRFWGELGIDGLDVALKLWTISGDIEAGRTVIFKARQRIGLHQKGS